ncbi:SDR family oxidoreductase [Mycolicibacterium stellerae]|uniref:SDR family oxidoreductase n=1 Tax=Mycolicibacterium stellerae TaxID=2358193 RepID=UPI000F0B37A6|nr:SDR family oxidoreductase [Mycolicibacterium stellerae]
MARFEPSPARRPAIVAGASSGIGAATARELARRGFPVALGARRIDKLAELVDQIRNDGGEAVAFPIDVTDDSSVKYFVGRAIEALGGIELVVSGAGDMTPGRIHDISTGDFLEQIQIHLIGANRLATAVLPAMVSRRRGDIIFIGSDTALLQRPHMGAYGAAKAGLLAMVKNLQMELEGTGVRASIIHPGPTSTNMGGGLPLDQLDAMLQDWVTWGHGRHSYSLRASDIARNVAFVAQTPRGVNITQIEIQPEAPLHTP